MLKVLNYKHLLFFFIIVLQMVIYNYPYIANIEPRTLHAWRQFDCLSFAQGFYNDRGSFFEPVVNNLGANYTGAAASDFPIIQYIVGNIWKVTGINSTVYRLFNLVFLVIGLFYIYKLFLQEFKHKIFAALLAAFIFTSANLSYYGISTISDIQSMALSMMGFYFFYNWVKFKTNKNLIIAIIAFSLAGLLKASSAMIYSLSLLYLVFWHIESRGSKQKIFTKQNCLRLLLLMFPFIIVIAWYSYVKDYNTKNYNGFFLIGTLPIWELEPQKINDNLRSLIFNLIPQILNPVILFAILIFIITNSFFSIKSFFSNSVILICCVVVFILYILLFFDALNVHDYYLINMTGVLVITIFFIFKIIFNRLKQYNFRITLFILGFMVLFNTYTSSAKTWKKINFNVTTFENSFLFNAEEQNNFFWIYWLDRAMFKPLEDKEFKLEKVGILSTDTIFCIGDQTINRSLYLLNRVGYTSVNSSVSQMPQFVKEHQNIKYIILIDSTLRKTPHLQTIFKNKIYEKESLSIYKVKK